MAKRRQTFERAARKRRAARRANAVLKKPHPSESPEQPPKNARRTSKVQKD